MTRTHTILAFAFISAAAASPALARDEKTPDWPCVQRKVETVSVSLVWDGPPIEGLTGWWDDKDLSALIDVLTSRKISVEDAGAKLKAYAASLPADKRDERLTLLFAGFFDKMSSQRRSVLSGLEKYLNGQRDRATEIEKLGAEITKLEDNKMTLEQDESPELRDKRDKFEWASRVFKERQDSIPVACEVPVIIDQRMFEIAKVIRAAMSK